MCLASGGESQTGANQQKQQNLDPMPGADCRLTLVSELFGVGVELDARLILAVQSVRRWQQEERQA